MTYNNNDEELKIKNTLLINLSSRSHEKKVKFTRWVNAQGNAQSSLLSIIEHMIDRFGYEDVMEHEIAKKLYKEQLHFTDIEKPSLNAPKTPTNQVIEASEPKDNHKAHEPEPERIESPVNNSKIDPAAF